MGWAGILYNSYNSSIENVFATDGVDRKRIESGTMHEWGMAATETVTAIEGGVKSGLTGDYNAVYTWCRKEGSTVVCESNPSPAAAAAVSLADGSLKVTRTSPLTAAGAVTHWRIYRTLADGAIYYYDQEVAIATVTVDTNTADLSLGAEVEIDHDRPPLGITHLSGPTYDGTVFGIVGNLVYFCKPKQIEYWPTTYFIEVSQKSDPGQCIVFHNGQPHYHSKQKTFFISGTGYNTFFPMPMETITGAQSPNGAVSVYGKGIFHVGSDGIYLYSSTDSNITQDQFTPIFRGIETNGMPGAGCLWCSWLVQFNNKLYFGYPISHGQYAYCHDWEAENEDTEEGYLGGIGYHFTETDETNSTEDCFSWEEDTTETTYDYDTTSTGPEDRYPKDMLVFNLDNKRTSYYTHPYELTAIAVDRINGKLIASDSAGFIWHLEDPTTENDDGTAIAWEVQSKDFTLQTRRHFPRWVKYDVDASDSSCGVTGELIMDGVSHQSHTITGTRETKRRLVETGNGRRVSVKISGTGPVKIYAAEGE